jgi:hypothetical protein
MDMADGRTGGGVDALRESVEQAIVAASGLERAAPATPEQFLALIVAGEHASAICAASQRRAVEQARRTGLSWAAIGQALGTTRQAAQQRFSGDDAEPPEKHGTRVVRGATAFNEMKLLAEEGAKGNHLVGFGGLYLLVQHSQQTWEHRREVAWNIATRRTRLEKAGWTHVGSWFPFHYFKRVRG